MGAATYIGRVGGLAVSLGIGAAVVAGWGCAVASADDGSSSSAASSSASSSSGPAHAQAASKRRVATPTSKRSPRAAAATGTGTPRIPTEDSSSSSSAADATVTAAPVVAATPTPTALRSSTGGNAPVIPTSFAAFQTALGAAHRDIEAALSAPGTAAAPAAAAPSVKPAAAAVAAAATTPATFTGQPSFSTQVFVAVLRIVNPLLKLAGLDLTGSSKQLPLLSDGIPPSFLTGGLKVGSSDYNGWKVWTLTPADPSGKYVIAVHGGAFISQVNFLQWSMYADMARSTGATLVVPLYPLANAQGTGGTAATVVPTMADFIASEVATYGGDNVSVFGDSVGGTIALAAAEELVRRCNGDAQCRANSLPGHIVLASPFLDLSMTNPNISLVDDPLLNIATSKKNAKLWAAGLGTPGDPDGTKNPLASPLYGSLEGLPPVTVYAGTMDLRAPDVLVLQDKALATPGADFTFVLRNGLTHDWVIFPFLTDAIAARPGIYSHLGLT